MKLLSFDLNLIKEYGEGKYIQQFGRLDPMLQAIFLWACAFVFLRFGKQLLITSIDRDCAGAGVHSYHRGLDFDVDEMGVYQGLIPAEAAILAGRLNELFQYDPERPTMHVCIYGALDKDDKHWNHVHLQTCYKNLTNVRNGGNLDA